MVRVPAAKVALSTASVYPESTATAFEIAARLGYDGVEVMVWTDPVSQDIEALRRLSDYHQVPILAVHAPCLLITQRVWSTDPWVKLQRARAAAEKLGASTVVVHPPFRWQRQYARDFVSGIWRMAGETDVRFAVENMYPWRYRDRELLAYAPDWDVTKDDYRHFTVDLSHTATARADALAMIDRMGDRLGHVHLADGRGSGKDEHLVPGRGTQPCAELLGRLAESAFDGHVVIEVNTRRAMSAAEREADLAEALAFARLHLAASAAGESVMAAAAPATASAAGTTAAASSADAASTADTSAADTAGATAGRGAAGRGAGRGRGRGTRAARAVSAASGAARTARSRLPGRSGAPGRSGLPGPAGPAGPAGPSGASGSGSSGSSGSSSGSSGSSSGSSSPSAGSPRSSDPSRSSGSSGRSGSSGSSGSTRGSGAAESSGPSGPSGPGLS